ncbi:two-component system, OmpR family, sensor histidine kinase KdpD [Pseudoalteromonas ulvae UL12]|uniref:HAMP domain-containing sensor histidine kinase n=1 Tax=Pseudoalteromonas ulvae TaxID=107327 RepID=UPI00186B600F|nr:HAMP domain-containing sensor histidine kinase [Pseudoalteromonas ulvae]MBE0364712.1 two-component system, OmpR family, sensor histidine kinase KdpD [Pseudoalteromonas ulvae UL12]
MKPKQKRHLHSRLTHKLLFAFSVIFLFSCLIGWLYFDSSERYSKHAKQSDLTHEVLTQYSLIAKLSLEKLIAMGEIVRTGRVQTPQLREENEQQLRGALFSVRDNLLKKIALSHLDSANKELQMLDLITQKVEQIINTNNEIKFLVAQDKLVDANQLFNLLQKQNVDKEFNQLINKAVSQEQALAQQIRNDVNTLYHFSNQALAAALAAMSLFTLMTFWYFWRRINDATKQLHTATSQYSDGNLAHRINALSDFEFQYLGDALNSMASQLASQQAQLNEAKRSLEEKVAQRTQDLERSNQKLALVDQQRRQFLADISHELRTPLTIIRGESEVLLRSQSAQLPDYKEVLQRVVDEVQHTTALIEDLMLVARSSAGQLKLNIHQFDLKNLLTDIQQVYQRKANAQQQEITLFLANQEAFIDADERRLRQVLMILLENALAYSPSQTCTEIHLLIREELVVIKVIDQGMGIPKEEQQQVFERFYRGNRGQTPGSGLGLPVAKAIIDGHGGHISLQPNSHGQGCTATVLLPILGVETA